MSMMARPSRAFTLIELLVVIAIIALLMAIIVPAFAKAKESARELVCKSHLSNIGLGVTMFLQDNDWKPIDSHRNNGFYWYDAAGKVRPVTDGEAYWGVGYISFVKEPEVFGCPSFRSVADLEGVIYNVNPRLIYNAAYSINSWLFLTDLNNTTKTRPTVSTIHHPAEFIICHDHVEPKIEQGAIDMFHNSGEGTMNLTHYRQGGARSKFYRGIFRHNIRSNGAFETQGRANILWLDAHVTTLQETTGDDVPEWWYSGNCPHDH
jgi:prepilin-type N-terminal cleavage/methylation domain-containing protein/prepilin-type processing-associated H-X9-DG protein